jgi:predicted dehydrogenase
VSRRVAVVGVGHMGRYHARKVAALRDRGGPATLVGVADIDAARARRVARETGSAAFVASRELLRSADAAIVAVPTADHYAVVNEALDAGCDVLVEKPIATDSEQAEALVERARRRGLVLQVGSQEWFNPALQALRAKLERPRFVEGRRVGPFSARAADVDVVRDLMIHDLDILQRLLGQVPVRIDAVGVAVVSDRIDVANARLVFGDGCVASLTASRVSVTRSRRMRWFGRHRHGCVDFLAPSASLTQRVEPLRGFCPQVEEERLVVGGEDALARQLAAFLDALDERAASLARADEALLALRAAERVVAAMPSPRELR